MRYLFFLADLIALIGTIGGFVWWKRGKRKRDIEELEEQNERLDSLIEREIDKQKRMLRRG